MCGFCGVSRLALNRPKWDLVLGCVPLPGVCLLLKYTCTNKVITLGPPLTSYGREEGGGGGGGGGGGLNPYTL